MVGVFTARAMTAKMRKERMDLSIVKDGERA